MITGRTHADEVDTDVTLVRRSLAARFPRWADLAVGAVRSTVAANALYRLGERLGARPPRAGEWAHDLDKEPHAVTDFGGVGDPAADVNPARGFFGCTGPKAFGTGSAASRSNGPP